MFKRLITSLSRPQQTIFFIKDSWKRIVLYVLLLPLILLIPALITNFVDPSMDINRYELLTQTIEEDFRVDNAMITNGVLTYETPTSASFNVIFYLYLGEQTQNKNSFNFVFEQNDLVLYVTNQEVDRESYANLNLLNHDFSSTDTDDLRDINLALKSFMEKQTTIMAVDMMASYTFNLVDYLFVVSVMSVMMLLFIVKIKIPFFLRLKLSIYLTSVWVISEFTLSLFHAESLEFISILLVYIYHIIAYRSIKVINKEVI